MSKTKIITMILGLSVLIASVSGCAQQSSAAKSGDERLSIVCTKVR